MNAIDNDCSTFRDIAVGFWLSVPIFLRHNENDYLNTTTHRETTAVAGGPTSSCLIPVRSESPGAWLHHSYCNLCEARIGHEFLTPHLSTYPVPTSE